MLNNNQVYIEFDNKEHNRRNRIEFKFWLNVLGIVTFEEQRLVLLMYFLMYII